MSDPPQQTSKSRPSPCCRRFAKKRRVDGGADDLAVLGVRGMSGVGGFATSLALLLLLGILDLDLNA